jgi:hypothetical protein
MHSWQRLITSPSFRWAWDPDRLAQPFEIYFQTWNKISAWKGEGLLSGMDFVLRRANQGLTAENGGDECLREANEVNEELKVFQRRRTGGSGFIKKRLAFGCLSRFNV